MIFIFLKVKPEQVVLSHSPMRLYKDLLDMFVLVLGQQNTSAIAKSYPFYMLFILIK